MPTAKNCFSETPAASRYLLLVVGLVLTLVVGWPLHSQERPISEDSGQFETADQKPQEARKWVIQLTPSADFYPHYIADSLRSQSALLVLAVPDSEIPETGNGRFSLRLGGRYAFVRWHPLGAPDTGFQLDFEGGFQGHFDLEHSLDNIGWDGFFGLLLSWKPSPRLALRIGTLHDSAHVGDEYAERTGRQRVGYSRNEIVLGSSYRVSPSWRTYGELGWQLNPDVGQESLRAQGGAEYMGSRMFLDDRVGWYGAVDLKSYEENDWSIRTSAQVGFILPTGQGTNRWRLALEYSDGRSVLGEFYFRDERYIGPGLYFDF